MSQQNLTPVTLITGGGTGIGAACAQRLYQAGQNIVLVGRRRDPLLSVAHQCDATVFAGDVCDMLNWQTWKETLRANGQRVNRVICSAGGMGLGQVKDISDEDWQQALNSNLTSAFATARACLPDLIASHGNIVFVASIASLAAGPAVCGYTTAKHALLGLMRSIARDYGPMGVRANAVCPGWVRTPMADEEMQPLMQEKQLSIQHAYTYVCRHVPLKRPATADEIAAICQFLTSDDAAIVTGATWVADGGATIVDVPTLAFDA